ncbi:hypothetical protein NLI96_g3698 [Meripilus lineatus]|uniref:Reverse transcriptase domain-containing protein n=1 Tax=Meripilus lineatus TaxID=2056292 RepID=A0AAD5V6A7_9APHY|nr:hypothetical protein NLI96_g3698 [Physisporinus lineatus]
MSNVIDLENQAIFEISFTARFLFRSRSEFRVDQDSAPTEDRIELSDAPKECHLNVSALSDPDSIHFPVSFIPISNSDLSTLSAVALIDSGSLYCFIDPAFVHSASLHTTSITPIPLRLFNSSKGQSITQVVHELPLCFPSSDIMPLTFYITPLDSTCSIVLGYSWLTHYNLGIDWVLRCITFPPLLQEEPPQTSTDAPACIVTAFATSALLSSTPPSISLVNAAAFLRASKLEGSNSFCILLSDLSISTSICKVLLEKDQPDLSNIPHEYYNFADVLSESQANTLALHHLYDLKINLDEGVSPLWELIYSLSQDELHALCEFIEENLCTGFIRPSCSLYGVPVLFVQKKDRSLQLCGDYRGLNKISKKDKYLLPLLSDLLDAPRKARLYTKIDLCHVYHLLVMPFGLSNVPAIFQWFMNDIFSDMVDVCVVIYLDNILVYSNDPAEHKHHVREVLCRLCKHGLYARADKCKFNTETVKYLGYILLPERLKMSSDKVCTILDWPEPHKVKDIQSFLSFCNFYHQFIEDYFKITVSLMRLTRKGTPRDFLESCWEAFDTLKQVFTSASVFAHWIPDSQIVVETDMFDYTLGAILSIFSADFDIYPIAFHSHTFIPPELNYDIHDKELLAIFETFKIWCHYLEGSALPMDVVTNYKNLTYFSTIKILTHHQACWSKYLFQFNLVVHFCPGRLGTKPDVLIHKWDIYAKGRNGGYAFANPQNLKPIFTQDQLSTSLCATILFFPVLHIVSLLDYDQLISAIHFSYSSDSLAPRILSTLLTSSASSDTPSTSAPALSASLSHWNLSSSNFFFLNRLIYIPNFADLCLCILHSKYDHILSDHLGQRLRRYVQDYIKSYTTCMQSKSQLYKPYSILQQLPIPPRPWDSISMDFIEPLPTSAGSNAILVVVDCLFKQAEFAYNNTPYASTGVSPFFANKGYHPTISIHSDCDIVSEQAYELITDLDELYQVLRQIIADSQRHYQDPANSCRALPPPSPVEIDGEEEFTPILLYDQTYSFLVVGSHL